MFFLVLTAEAELCHFNHNSACKYSALPAEVRGISNELVAGAASVVDLAAHVDSVVVRGQWIFHDGRNSKGAGRFLAALKIGIECLC